MKFINFNNLNKGLGKFKYRKTFPYTVIDNFFNEKIAKKSCYKGKLAIYWTD